MQQLLTIKAYGSICTSIVDEKLALIALRHKDQILDRNNRIISKNIQHFHSVVSQQTTLDWVKPKVNALLSVMKINSLPENKAYITQWCQRLAKEQEVMLLPCFLFGLPGNYFRLGLGRKNFECGINRLVEFLRSH